MATRNQLDTLIDRLHRTHPDLTIAGQPALPFDTTSSTYGRLAITDPASDREYTLELRSDGISLTLSNLGT